MKKLVILGLLSLLTACSGSNSNSGLEQETNLFSFAMEERNLCGQTSPYMDYEVVAYSDEGDIISRHKPNQQGAISAQFAQSQVNLMIIRDRGQDNPGLDVTVLTQYPVGDLGTFSVSTINTEGCDCQIVDIEATYPPPVYPYMIFGTSNLPNKGFSLTGFFSSFSESHICKLPTGEDPLLIVSTAENTFEEPKTYEHVLLENPSDHIYDGVISTQFMPQTDFVNDVSIIDGDASNIFITYFSDNLYPLYFPLQNGQSFKLIEHPRVTDNGVTASNFNYSSVDDSTDRFEGWSVYIPVNESTRLIDYAKPNLDQIALEEIFNGQLTSYNVNSNALAVISKSFGIERENGSIDQWSINFLNSLYETPQFSLPSDYLSNERNYFESTRSKGISIIELTDSMSANDFFESGWFEILFHGYHSNNLDPVSEYSNLQRPTKPFSKIFLSELPTHNVN